MGENISIDWFAKFFTYSSIQVKFIATFIAILIFIILRRIILRKKVKYFINKFKTI